MPHEDPEVMGLEVGSVIGGVPLSSGCRGRQSQIRHGELGVLPAIVGGWFAPVMALTSDYNQGDRNHRW